MTENNKNFGEKIENIREHRNDIDTLRVFATILLIYFHTAMFFVLAYGVFFQNEELSLEITIFYLFLGIWHMPLFFFLAGMSTFYSLNFRSGTQYVKDRLKRLFIPFILGIFIVIPPIFYFYPIIFDGTYFEFYLNYFENGYLTYGIHFSRWYIHLWFLLYLLVFSMVALPVFLMLKKKKKMQQKISVFLLALPLILISVCLNFIFPSRFGVLNFIYDLPNVFGYFIIFIFGFLIVGNSRFENSIDRNKKLAFALAVITSVIVLFIQIHTITASNIFSSIGIYIGAAIFLGLFTFCRWCWLFTFFGYGRKYLTKKTSLISHLSEISLPFYILHLPVIIIIAYFVLQWEAIILVKFLIITTSALFITIFLCELIKTNNITRFIFGMRPKVKKKEVE
ncbi:MAG: acyltransferase family protein [Promethearchaeota archaeon]